MDGAPDRSWSWMDRVTTDADDAAGIQREWMPIEYDQIDAGRFAGRFQQLGFERTRMVIERQDRAVLKRQYFPGDYCTVSLIRSVSGQGRCELAALAARSVGYMPGDRDYEIVLPPSEILFFRIDQARLIGAAETLGHALPGDGRRMLFSDHAGTGHLDEIADMLMAVPRETLFAGANPAYLDDVVLERMLGVLDPAAPSSRFSSSASAHRVTRAARELIEADDAEPLTVMTLCRRLGVSRASLQRGFLQVYGIAPLAYLRMRRLNGARRELKRARESGGADATVAATAMRWGFFHVARFSRDYFTHFGELPSATLGRAPRTGRRT